VRYAAKRDQSEPAIVAALEKAGCKVWRNLPVDLLVRVPRDPPGVARLIECKTPKGKDQSLKLRKDQEAQAEFIALTGTAYATNPTEALQALGLL